MVFSVIGASHDLLFQILKCCALCFLSQQHQDPPSISLGFYVDKGTITFKTTLAVHNSPLYGPQKLIFRPILTLLGEGGSVEITSKGDAVKGKRKGPGCTPLNLFPHFSFPAVQYIWKGRPKKKILYIEWTTCLITKTLVDIRHFLLIHWALVVSDLWGCDIFCARIVLMEILHFPTLSGPFFSSFQIGLSAARAYGRGDCICGVKDHFEDEYTLMIPYFNR